MAINQSTIGGGTTAVLNFGHNMWIDGLKQLSIFVWAAINQISSSSGHDNFMVAKRAADGPGTGLFIANATTGAGGTNNNIEFTANNWATTEGDWFWDGAQDANYHTHLVTYDYGSTSNVPSYYLDGIARSPVLTASSPAGSLTSDTTNLTVGGEGGNTKSFGGSIAHAAIWNAVLTPTEAQLLTAGMPPPLIRPDALAFYCPCSQDPTQALDLGRAQLGTASVTGTWLPADDPYGLLLPARGEAPVAFSPVFQSLPYRRPNMPLYRR